MSRGKGPFKDAKFRQWIVYERLILFLELFHYKFVNVVIEEKEKSTLIDELLTQITETH